LGENFQTDKVNVATCSVLHFGASPCYFLTVYSVNSGVQKTECNLPPGRDLVGLKSGKIRPLVPVFFVGNLGGELCHLAPVVGAALVAAEDVSRTGFAPLVIVSPSPTTTVSLLMATASPKRSLPTPSAAVSFVTWLVSRGSTVRG